MSFLGVLIGFISNSHSKNRGQDVPKWSFLKKQWEIIGCLLQHSQDTLQPALAFIHKVGVLVETQHVTGLTHLVHAAAGQARNGLDGSICR